MISGSDAAITLGALRRVLLGILLFGMAGTTTELLLLQHLEDVSQAIPLALLGCGYAVVAWNSWRHSRLSVTAMQILMVLFAASGVLGMYFHYSANAEFQREIDPTLAGSKLWWTVLQAKTPPALAPGVMALLGLIGLAYAYRHPATAVRGELLQENRNEL